MKIIDIETIAFKTEGTFHLTKWGGLEPPVARETVQTITRVVTDEGIEGYMMGGDKTVNEHVVKPILVGQDPLGRERIWMWLNQICTTRHMLSERDAGIIDSALWDLYGRMVGLPLYQLLGGSRDRVRAYASSFDHLGDPLVYAEQAVACRDMGYMAYKIHPNVCWDPSIGTAHPMTPGFPKEDVAICKAVREAVGDEMVLMLDPFSSYTLEQALWVGRRLEELDFYWLEQPLLETKMEACRRLAQQLDIAILGPEHIPGGIFTRVEFLLQGAADIGRVDVNYGGITGAYKMASICQALGLKCEMHGAGWWHAHLVGAFPESVCEYYERGLLHPDLDYDARFPFMQSTCDPLDDQGNVILPQNPGLGFTFDWDYINAHRI